MLLVVLLITGTFFMTHVIRQWAVPSVGRSAAADIPIVVGAIPYWDQQDGLKTLQTDPGHVDVASPSSYSVSADGSIDLQQYVTASSEKALDESIRQLGVKVIPIVANTTAGLWDRATISRVINDSNLRRAHVAALVKLIQDNDYDGIQIDYENLNATDRTAFTAFVTELSDSIHRIGKVLYVTVHAKETDAGYDQRNEAQDFAAIGRAADEVSLMAYDWHWETGPPGPIAPYDWVERVTAYAVTQIPPAKLLLGLGLFGYDWIGSKATDLTWNQVTAVGAKYAGDEKWDVGSQSPHFSYSAAGVTHQVWYENARSVGVKLDIAREHHLAGVALWRLGREDLAIWTPGP